MLDTFWVIQTVQRETPTTEEKMRQVIIVCTIFISCTRQNSNFKAPINDISGFENFAPKFEDAAKIFEEKCAKNGAKEKMFDTLTNAPMELNSCLENYLNFTVIQEELEESKKTGSMDEVFRKYCGKYPEIYECLKNSTDTLRPCLSSAEREFLDEVLGFIGTLKEYLCFKDGSRISLFISQGGIECADSKREKVQQCLNETIADSLFKNVSVNTFPALLRFNDSTFCNDLFKTRSCFYENLSTCDRNIPANVMEGFFKFLKKQLSCETPLLSGESTMDDIWIRVIIVLVFILVVAIISYKLAT